MSDYRRYYLPGGTFFFTLVTHHRIPLFSHQDHITLLKNCLRQVKSERPFDILAGVILPDHLHFLWTLPPGDSNYPTRLGRLKALFSRSVTSPPPTTPPNARPVTWASPTTSPNAQPVGWAPPTTFPTSPNASRLKHHESAIWQRRYWEHTIRDERDLEHHLHYIHYNPVKHGLTSCPHAWPHSSFHHWVTRSTYAPDWCCTCHTPAAKVPYPDTLSHTVGE